MRLRALAAAAAAAALLALLAGCAGGTGGTRAPASRSGAGARSEVPYRWLIDPRVPAASVAAENARGGSRAWRMPGPPAAVGGLARGDLAGYVSAPAVTPGQSERIYVRAPGARRVRIRIFRMGFYGGAGGREVLRSDPLAVRRQPPCVHDSRTGLTRCAWHPTLFFTVPAGMRSGVYIVGLSTAAGARSDCLFVVRDPRPTGLVVMLPDATYEAYNAWGGDSLYPGGARTVALTGSTQGVEVSYLRPYASVTGAGEFFARDVAAVRFLERLGVPVSYTDSLSVDADPGQLSAAKALMDIGHSEYWSTRERSAFTAARDRGAGELFLSSDTMAWRVRFGPGLTLTAYKEHAALDPERSAPSGATPDFGASLTGSAYYGCIDPRIPGPGPPAYRLYDWMPDPSLRPSWLFAGTGVRAATRIPGIVGYELDERSGQSPAGTLRVGGGSAPCSANEPGEPVPSSPPRSGRRDVAESTLYTGPSGAVVFSSGTLSWELGLSPVPSASPDAPRAPDPRVQAMTRNLIARVLSGRAG